LLLRWYDRLKARWKPLPWILLAVFILLFVAAGYVAVKLLEGMRV